jgi:hypothetical protein
MRREKYSPGPPHCANTLLQDEDHVRQSVMVRDNLCYAPHGARRGGRGRRRRRRRGDARIHAADEREGEDDECTDLEHGAA